MAQAAATDGPQLILRSVGKTFGNDVVALRDVNMTINHGDFLSLLGPSGCGKSTALRLVAGLSSPTSGLLDWRGPPMGKSDVGFVFQEPTLMPWATVFENVWLPLRLQGVSRAEATPQVSEVLAQVNLTGFENAVPRELSGGMKMRVSIARGLVTRPRLLLMDEPFAALDEITRFQLNSDLLALWEQERFTVIFVTHSVFESVFLSNRIVVMAAHPGRVYGEMEVDAPYPRDEQFRTSEDYAHLTRKASSILRAAMGIEDGEGAHPDVLH
ncbi:ABC transporter ATP-binding protein [Oricola nitratireducens]|jgi:NitT/TauT family transport system ATP-binding protein|uniref:ABC transporter ATP-binding protein n=1 Tax=Oricola nitratireducens TaxID=2775868 RepID=UPI0018684E6A|nr:ABC transporter ATP-binding protein [Oricola nitratireducens]